MYLCADAASETTEVLNASNESLRFMGLDEEAIEEISQECRDLIQGMMIRGHLLSHNDIGFPHKVVNFRSLSTD